jgi:hypothetical protein
MLLMTKVLSIPMPIQYCTYLRTHIVDNLGSIGINLGNDVIEVGRSVDIIKSRENIRYVDHDTKDEISRIF